MASTLPLVVSAEKGSGEKKQWEYLLLSRDPLYPSLVEANRIVMQYIADHGLVLYGGIAIDYALKLQGAEGIYLADMAATPDLDFYSSTSVTDSYRLADLLYERGNQGARAIAALHIETMKVDCGDKHWVADISYRSAAIMSIIPTLEWQGMKLVHPHFQRLDMHSALSTPYDNPPNEVIFARWAKDLRRFRLLESAYPFPPPVLAAPVQYRKWAIPPRARSLVWCGFAALALMRDCAAAAGVRVSDLPIGGNLAESEGASYFLAPVEADGFEFISYKPVADMRGIGIEPESATAAIANMQTIQVRGRGGVGGDPITGISVGGHLISIATVLHPATLRKYRIVNAQYLLYRLLAASYCVRLSRDPADKADKAAERKSRILGLAYWSLLTLIERAEAVPDLFPLFGLSVETYGADNTNMAKSMMDDRVLSRLTGEAGPTIQQNYYPDRRGVGQYPDFDPEMIHYFRDDGRPISIASVP